MKFDRTSPDQSIYISFLPVYFVAWCHDGTPLGHDGYKKEHDKSTPINMQSLILGQEKIKDTELLK